MDEEIKARLEKAGSAPDAEKQLILLVDELKCEGWSQLEVYAAFETYMVFLRNAKRDAEEEIVTEVLDFIWGWCSPSAQLFPQSLTNEEVHKYKLSKQSKSER